MVGSKVTEGAAPGARIGPTAAANLRSRKPKREGRSDLFGRSHSDFTAMGFGDQSRDVETEPQVGVPSGTFHSSAGPRLKDGLLNLGRNH